MMIDLPRSQLETNVEFTTREIATAMLAVAVVLLAIWLSKDRKGLLRSIAGVAKAFSAWKVWSAVLAYFIYIGVVVALARVFGVWSLESFKDTLLISIFVGLPILFNSTKFKDGNEVVKGIVKEVLGVAAVMVGYVNLSPLSLWAELVLQAFVILCVILATVGKREPKTASVGRFFEILTGLVGVGMIAYVTIRIITHFGDFDWRGEGVAFALSIWLPLALLPFIYVFGFIAACEATLVRAKFHNGKNKLPLRVRVGFVLGTEGGLRFASSFSGLWLTALAEQRTLHETVRMMSDYRRTVRHNSRQNRARRRRLKEDAGKTGVGSDGLWTDRREFQETKKALENLFYSQMGLYRNRGGRYWTDPLVLFPLGGFNELPENHGVNFQVRNDGQAWFAWRRTVGGYYFGVGGTSDLDRYWRYASAEVPKDYPNRDSAGWNDVSVDAEVCPEWLADDGPVQLAAR